MLPEKHQKDKAICDDLTVMHFENERLAAQHINKEFIAMNIETRPHSMFKNLSTSEQNSSSVTDTSLSLILSLRMNDSPVLSEILSSKIGNNDQSIQNSTSCFSSLNVSLAKKPPNASYQTPHSITISTNKRTTLDEPISNLPDIPTSQLEKTERRKHRENLQREIITIAKKAIKPAYKKHYISKENYKIIMKKVVTKATYSNKIDQQWINKTIHSYVKKYRIIQSI